MLLKFAASGGYSYKRNLLVGSHNSKILASDLPLEKNTSVLSAREDVYVLHPSVHRSARTDDSQEHVFLCG